MQPTETAARRYDPTTIALHWLTLLLVAEQWIGAHLIDDFARGTPRVMARSVHITFGVVVVLLLLARLAWRGTRGRRLPAADRGALHVLAKATHWGMYALLAAILVLGVLTAFLQGDSIYTLFSLPSPAPDDRALRRAIVGYHAVAANIILAVAGLHAAAALAHQFVWRDGLLLRMVPVRTARSAVRQRLRT